MRTTCHVFDCDAHEIYLALLKERSEHGAPGASAEVLARQFRLRLHRGIAHLAAPQSIQSIADLIWLATREILAGNLDRKPRSDTQCIARSIHRAGTVPIRFDIDF
jgi:hypothetical protein